MLIVVQCYQKEEREIPVHRAKTLPNL